MAKQTFTTGQVLTAAQMTDLQQTAMTGGAASTKTVSYVLVAADAGTRIAMNAAGSTTITVNTSLFSAGDTVSIQNLGAGVCTVTAGTATVNTSGSLVLAQYQGGILYFTSASAAIFFQFATPASGDIEGVTAGTGISGGGTSGTVTITNSMATEIAAKADLIVGTGSATFDNLTVGANGTVLTADSTVSPTGLKWAAPAGGGGKVLQVVYASYNTDTSSTSATYADTGLTATITPTLATSKVLVLVQQNGCRKEGNTSINLKLFRGATELLKFAELLGSTATTARNNVAVGASYLDSPSTTSATTYKTQFAADNGATAYVQNSTSASTITLLEIGA
jgi:hypothetical protein